MKLKESDDVLNDTIQSEEIVVSKQKLDPEAKKAVFDSTKQSISNLSLRKDGIRKAYSVK
jgi:hypothetical protein